MEKIDLVIELLKSGQAENVRRFVAIEHRLDRIEDEMKSDKEKLQAVYDAREKVKIQFGWPWSLVSSISAVLVTSYQ